MNGYVKLVRSVFIVGAIVFTSLLSAMKQTKPPKPIAKAASKNDEKNTQKLGAGVALKVQRLFCNIKNRDYSKVQKCFEGVHCIDFNQSPHIKLTDDDIFWVLLTAVEHNNSTIINKVLHADNCGIDYMDFLRPMGDNWFNGYNDDDFGCVDEILSAARQNSYDFFTMLIRHYPNPKKIFLILFHQGLIKSLTHYLEICSTYQFQLHDFFLDILTTQLIRTNLKENYVSALKILLQNVFFMQQVTQDDLTVALLWIIEFEIFFDDINSLADVFEWFKNMLDKHEQKSLIVENCFLLTITHDLEKAATEILKNDEILELLDEDMIVRIFRKAGEALRNKTCTALINDEKFNSKLPSLIKGYPADTTKDLFKSYFKDDLSVRGCLLF